ncbi:hypothetical protein BC834DRAFT_244883 [Gloeopeniophorella convolvens]|nr:hypothetical protein BC834DRAFT_244883 [Gloeopeniophorella convolvens]
MQIDITLPRAIFHQRYLPHRSSCNLMVPLALMCRGTHVGTTQASLVGSQWYCILLSADRASGCACAPPYVSRLPRRSALPSSMLSQLGSLKWVSSSAPPIYLGIAYRSFHPGDEHTVIHLNSRAEEARDSSISNHVQLNLHICRLASRVPIDQTGIDHHVGDTRAPGGGSAWPESVALSSTYRSPPRKPPPVLCAF